MKATALHVYIKDAGATDDDPISVEHVFYGTSEADAEAKRDAHLKGCENCAKADADGRTTETVEVLDAAEVPTWELLDGDTDPEVDTPEDEEADTDDPEDD